MNDVEMVSVTSTKSVPRVGRGAALSSTYNPKDFASRESLAFTGRCDFLLLLLQRCNQSLFFTLVKHDININATYFYDRLFEWHWTYINKHRVFI